MSASNDGPKEDSRYVCTEADLETAFAELKVDTDLESLKPSEHPTFVLFGGQAGAGKSQTIERVRHDNPELYVVDVDALREQHPYYAEIQRDYGIESSSYTHKFASALKNKVVEYLRERGVSFGLETTMSDPGSTVNLVEHPAWQEKGYAIDAYAAAVPREFSEIGVHNRYLHGRNQTETRRSHDGKEKIEVHKGRFMPLEEREKQWAFMPASMRELASLATDESSPVREIGVYDRDGAEAYRERGEQVKPDDVVKALETHRSLEQPTLEQYAVVLEQHAYNVAETAEIQASRTERGDAAKAEKRILENESLAQARYGKDVAEKRVEKRKDERDKRIAQRKAESKEKDKTRELTRSDESKDRGRGR